MSDVIAGRRGGKNTIMEEMLQQLEPGTYVRLWFGRDDYVSGWVTETIKASSWEGVVLSLRREDGVVVSAYARKALTVQVGQRDEEATVVERLIGRSR